MDNFFIKKKSLLVLDAVWNKKIFSKSFQSGGFLFGALRSKIMFDVNTKRTDGTVNKLCEWMLPTLFGSLFVAA